MQSACLAAGTRSLSDYTRSELFVGAKAEFQDDRIWKRFLDMDQKLTELFESSKRVLEPIHARIDPCGVRDQSDKLGSPAESGTGVESSASLDPGEKGQKRIRA